MELGNLIVEVGAQSNGLGSEHIDLYVLTGTS